MNSVVVVGLYYGFLTTFSIGPSYCLLFQAHIKVIEEGEKAIDKEVAAATGLIMGQLVMFISIYYTPLHLALGRPHTITFLVLSSLVLLFHWYNSEDFYGKRKHQSTRKNSMRNPSIQCIYLINLIYQLLNHLFFPSSMLARLVTIYMFRYNNKMLFVTSSFVGWLIGHILFMKWVKFVLDWIDQNYSVRANRYILSNKYLFYVFRFYQDFIFDFKKSMNRVSSILVLFICLCTFGRTSSPFLTHKIMQQGIPEEKHVEREKTSEEGFTAKDPSPSLFKLFQEAYYKNIPTSFSGNQDISKLEILKEDSKISLWVEKPLLISILFDYNRWNRPTRYIKNKRLENAVRNEMSQFYFSTCQNDGKERISFSYPPSLALFREMIQRKISVFATQNYDKLYNDWISTNEQKKKSLSNEFSNRIAVLDKKGLKTNVLEKKIRLCNDKKNKDGQSNLDKKNKEGQSNLDKKNKEYLPNRYDPLINGSYRGQIKKWVPNYKIVKETFIRMMCRIPSMIILNEGKIPVPDEFRFIPQNKWGEIFKNKWGIIVLLKKICRLEDSIWINRIQILLTKDYNYTEKTRKIRAESRGAHFVYFMCFIRDSLTQTIPKKRQKPKPIEINKIRKKVPRWPYKLLDELELIHRAEEDGVQKVDDIRELPARRIILFKTEETETEPSRQIAYKRYIPGPQLRDLIKGSMRSQKRKTSTWLEWQSFSHSRFFLNRTDSVFNRLVRFWYFIKGIFLKYMSKISEFELSAYYPSFADLFISIEESGEQEEEIDEQKEDRKNKIEEKIRECELMWMRFSCGQIIRSYILVTQSNIRKNIILPLLIIAKNIGRILLLQRSEWEEDFQELEKEVHYICTYNGIPSSENEFPELWKDEGIQIKVVYPFRLKPWHTSDQDKNDSVYLTAWGLTTKIPYGDPEYKELSSFFILIEKKLYKEFKKFRKKHKWIIVIVKKILKKILKKRLSKNLSKVNPNLEFELIDKSSEIIKENDSIINNQMIHESSIEAQFMNLTNYSLTQKRMKDLANRRSTIRNQMDKISKIVNISPNKTHYGVKRLESLQNIVQILKRRTARLISKSGFFMEKIYVDLFINILNISRIYTQKFFLFLESTKKNLYKSIYNNETNKNPIQFILTIKKSHFLFSSLLSGKIQKKLRSHSDLSFLSQAYVFYKLSQAQLINLYKLRSVFQYYGTSLFLKNEIKDYFGAQGIIHSELRTQKLPNSVMNPWKNWLKSNYQYGLSQREWSHLVPQKWRNEINKYFRGEKKNKKKWNSYEKEQLINSNYQNAKAPLLLLPNEKANLKKNHKYEVLSYKFLFHEDKKDSYSYRIPFQGNKNKEFSYTNNYNIHKGNLIDMWWSIPITYYFNITDIEETPDRKYFDWKIIHFDHLIKKGPIGAWIHNKYTKIEPKNYQIVYKFDIDDEIIDEKEKEIYEKEKKECFDDKNDIFCHKIYQKFYRSRKKFYRSHETKNLFDWMGMNEEILSRPVSIESWFFPEFVLLYNVYQIKPWTIPINLLFSDFENVSVNEKKNEKAIVNRKKNENPIDAVTIYKKKRVGHRKNFRSFIQKHFEKKENVSIHDDFICAEQKFFSYQMDWNKFVEDEDVLRNIDVGVLMLHLKEHKRRKRFAITFLHRGDLNMDIMEYSGVTPMDTLLEEGILFIELVRLYKIDMQLILYQTIGISWVHKSKKRQNNQKRSRDKNKYDLLIPENILSPRRRRELRILICLNSRNNKGVDKNPVYCNGNRVNKGSKFFDKSKDLDRDKKKLIKFFLWPNYRLEDLACMNRYWFDTNNGSRFSILRIRMYPRLKR